MHSQITCTSNVSYTTCTVYIPPSFLTLSHCTGVFTQCAHNVYIETLSLLSFIPHFSITTFISVKFLSIFFSLHYHRYSTLNIYSHKSHAHLMCPIQLALYIYNHCHHSSYSHIVQVCLYSAPTMFIETLSLLSVMHDIVTYEYVFQFCFDV